MTGARKIALVRGRPAAALAFGLGLGACQAGEVVTLGLSPPAQGTGGDLNSGSGGTSTGGGDPLGTGGLGGAPVDDSSLPLRFANVELVAELSSREKDDNPTLTEDQLLLCFTSTREGTSGSQDIWCSSRATTQERFDEPELLMLNSEEFETSPALSLDGLSLWFSSDREGGRGGADIYVSKRATRADDWGTPTLVDELNSEFDDIPRPPAVGDTIMPLASRRTDDTYWTYLARRETPDSPFSSPVLIEELTAPSIVFVDAHLSESGLLLLLTTVVEEGAPGDLYATIRTDFSSPFAAPVLIEGVNSEQDDRDPWLSPDGQTLYFSSDRDGDVEIYRATRVR